MQYKVHDLIIAHRGESYDAPENTVAAINLAWARNVHAVEIDIRLTKDNEIVVIHDSNTFRITGKRKTVSKSDLNELRLLDAGSLKGIKWKGEPVPTLNEVINTVPEHGKLVIEIKAGGEILDKLRSELSGSKLKDMQIEIIAVSERVLARAKRMMPRYKMLLIMDLDYSRPSWLCRISSRKIAGRIKKINADGVDCWSGKILNERFIKGLKDAGLIVYAWTVNDPVRAVRLINAGIDGITTDRAGWLSKQLSGSSPI